MSRSGERLFFTVNRLSGEKERKRVALLGFKRSQLRGY